MTVKRTLSNIQRKALFMKYNFKPFRFSLVASHTMKRVASLLGLKRGFRIIDLALTYKCNLACKHCSALVLDQDRPAMDIDDYKHIVDQSRQLDVLSWNITGGEPSLVPWLDELIPVLSPSDHYISIQTNCMLLTKDRARQLARAGVNCITTSVDDINPREHNEFRGNNHAFEDTFKGIKNARDAGMQVLIGGVVTHQNIRSASLEILIKKANDLNAIFLFNLAVPCGNWCGNEDVILNSEDREYLMKLMDKYPATCTDHEVGRNAIGCPAGMEKVYITPYGEVIPCPFIHVSFGNVLETPLTEIVDRMHETPYFSQYQKVCIAAEDRQFHDNVLRKVYDSTTPAPVPYKEIFGESHDKACCC